MGSFRSGSVALVVLVLITVSGRAPSLCAAERGADDGFQRVSFRGTLGAGWTISHADIRDEDYDEVRFSGFALLSSIAAELYLLPWLAFQAQLAGMGMPRGSGEFRERGETTVLRYDDSESWQGVLGVGVVLRHRPWGLFGEMAAGYGAGRYEIQDFNWEVANRWGISASVGKTYPLNDWADLGAVLQFLFVSTQTNAGGCVPCHVQSYSLGLGAVIRTK